MTRNDQLKQLGISLAIGTFLSTLSVVVANLAGWDFTFNWLEYIAVLSSYSCTYLCVVQSRWNYPIGVFTTLLYSILMMQWGLPALALFNLYLVFSLIYGYWRWGPDSNPRKVTDITKTQAFIIYPLVGLAVYVLLQIIAKLFNVEMMYTDVIAAVLSGVAQVMLDQKTRQTWIVWAVVNVFSIWLLFNQQLYLAFFQYIFFLINTVFGYIMWTKSKNQQVVS